MCCYQSGLFTEAVTEFYRAKPLFVLPNRGCQRLLRGGQGLAGHDANWRTRPERVLKLSVGVICVAFVAMVRVVCLAALAQGPQVYVCHGYHGGYYLTDEAGYRAALDELFALLDQAPACKAALELEPYTIERMAHGEAFAVERRGRDRPRLAVWGAGGPGKTVAECLPEAAHSGRFGMRLRLDEGPFVNLCQGRLASDLVGVPLRFTAWIRNRGGDAHLYIDAHSPGGVIAGSGKMTAPVPADGQWHEVSLDYIVPDGAATIYPQARITSPGGEADFDDFSLVRTDTGEQLLANADLEVNPYPTLLDQARLDRLKALVRAGRVEIIGGAYTQPIMYMLGQESVVQQFVIGCRAVEESLGMPVRIYAAQEPDWAGQMPQILSQMGFRAAIYRTNWQAFGAAPAYNAEMVWWIGPDGTRLLVVPMPEDMRSGWGLHGPSKILVDKLAAKGVNRPLFLDLADFVSGWVIKPRDPRSQGKIISGLVHLCRGMPATAAAGREIELSAWLRARQPGAHLYIDAYRGNNNLGRAESGCAPPDGQWRRLSLRWTVPQDAQIMYPQIRIYPQAESGDVDLDGVSLKVVETGEELVPEWRGEGEELPENWAPGSFEGAEVKAEVCEGDAKEGNRYVRLMMTPSVLQARMVTPSEYVDIIGEPREEWQDAYAGFEHRYPWGILGGYHLRADRAAERALLGALRLDAAAKLGLGAQRDDLWRLILIGHHHDAWVCGPVRGFGIWGAYERYADLTPACQQELAGRLDEATRAALAPAGSEVAIFNAAAVARREVRTVEWNLPAGKVHEPLVVDGAGRPVPAVVTVAEKHRDGSVAQVRAAFQVDVPALGWKRFRLVEAHGKRQPALRSVRVSRAAGGVRLENDTLGVEVTRQGLQFYRGGQAVLRAPAHLAGHFPDGPKESVFDNVTSQEGAGEATAVAEGSVGPVKLSLWVRLDAYSPMAQVVVGCDFGQRTLVGAPAAPASLPTWCVEEYKLRWVFPLRWDVPKFLVHGAFELRQPSRLAWPILDLALAQGPGGGLAVYPDRATSGLFRTDPANLEVVLAYGGPFMYAPGEMAPLSGRESYYLGVYPFTGAAEEAMVAQMAEAAAPALYMGPVDPARLPRGDGQVVRIEPGHAAALSTCYADGEDLVLRLWRPYAGIAEVAADVPGAKELWLANPTGAGQSKLSGGGKAVLSLRGGQILTLRAVGAVR